MQNRRFLSVLLAVGAVHVAAGAALLVGNLLSHPTPSSGAAAASPTGAPAPAPATATAAAATSRTQAAPPSLVARTATPPPATGSAAPAATGPVKHPVAKGETYTAIARKYGVDLDDLMAANGHDRKHLLKPGEVLVVPRP